METKKKIIITSASIFIVIIYFLAIFFITNHARGVARDVVVLSEVKGTQSELELYFMENDQYPDLKTENKLLGIEPVPPGFKEVLLKYKYVTCNQDGSGCEDFSTNASYNLDFKLKKRKAKGSNGMFQANPFSFNQIK